MPDTRGKSSARVTDTLPLAFDSNASTGSGVSRRVADGRLCRLATRLCVRNLDNAHQIIDRRNLWPIFVGYIPGMIGEYQIGELQARS